MENKFIHGNLREIQPLATSDNSLTPLIDFCCNKIRIEFTGSCLQQPKVKCQTLLKLY